MPKLSIRTSLNSVVLVGAFCGWDIDKAVRVDRKRDNKLIHFEDMPEGEYRVLSCRSYQGGEVYPTDRRQMANRYFNGEQDETINCYF
ncbi:MAG: hypothetical protein IJ459_04560 [Clostridia bacterium]|nr:hypothetical protein [Clostridia bacterium]